MGPQPQLGPLAYLLFQHLGIAVGEGKLWFGRCVPTHRDNLAIIVPAARACDVDIEDHSTQPSCQTLRAYEERGVVIEESRPVVHGFPLRALVGNEAYHQAVPLASQGDDAPQRLLHRDVHSAKAGTHLQEEVVCLRVAQRVIDLCSLHPIVHPQGEGGKPLPVAIMSQIGVGHLNAATLHLVLQLIQTHESYTAMHLLGAHRQFLDNLRHIVAQRVIESSHYLPTLADGLLREAVGQLSSHQPPPVPHHIIYHHEHHIREEVVHPKRQPRKYAQQPEDKPLSHFHIAKVRISERSAKGKTKFFILRCRAEVPSGFVQRYVLYSIIHNA